MKVILRYDYKDILLDLDDAVTIVNMLHDKYHISGYNEDRKLEPIKIETFNLTFISEAEVAKLKRKLVLDDSK